MLRVEKDLLLNQSPRKKHSLMKKMLERQQTNIETYIEESLDYDQIYIEARNMDGEVFSTYLTLKNLTALMTSNPGEQKANALIVGNRDKSLLV